MNIEFLIFIYVYLCICIVAFDILFIVYTGIQTRDIKRIKSRIMQNIDYQRDLYHRLGKFDSKKQAAIMKKMTKPTYLRGFYECITNMRQGNYGEFTDIYLSMIANRLAELATVYAKKNDEYKALYSYIISSFKLGENHYLKADTSPLTTIADTFEGYLLRKSIYVRENTLKGIVSLGIERNLLNGLYIMSEYNFQHNEKLVSDALLGFTGNRQNLADLLLQHLDSFSNEIKCAVIDFLRFLPKDSISQSQYFDRCYELLANKKTNKEVRFAIIRYFRKYEYPPLLDILVDFVQDTDDEKWEYAAIAASSLSSYNCEKSINALKTAVNSPNWYLRFNASESLIALGVDFEGLTQEMKDTYARQMLSYREKVHKLSKKQL